jgi:hypothetical protein
MSAMIPPTTNPGTLQRSEPHHFRFHLPHMHLDRIFGNDWFALKAEAFARFFGTRLFLVDHRRCLDSCERRWDDEV